MPTTVASPRFETLACIPAIYIRSTTHARCAASQGMKKFTREAFSLRAGEARKAPSDRFFFPAPQGTDHARDQEWEAPFVSCQRFFSPSSSIQVSNNYKFFPAKVMPTSGTWKVPFRGKFGAYDCAGGGDNRGGGGGGGQPQPKEYFQVESRYSWPIVCYTDSQPLHSLFVLFPGPPPPWWWPAGWCPPSPFKAARGTLGWPSPPGATPPGRGRRSSRRPSGGDG